MDQSFHVYIGLVASVLIAISIMMTNVKLFRIINLIGAATFATYGYLIDSLPVFVLNFFNTCVDIFYLVKMSRQKEYFTLNPTLTGNEFFFKEFIKYYKDDITKFFPNFVLTNAAPCLAKRVGLTQSKVSTPFLTNFQISLGSPIPNK